MNKKLVFAGLLTALLPLTGVQAQQNDAISEDWQTPAISSMDSVLEEVVVVGYGIQKKSDVNGAISLVEKRSLDNRSFSDVNQVLSMSPGVQVLTTSGYPGSSSTLRIRGISSNSSSAVEPLYIVDGLQMSSIDYLDVADIESMEVLKDGASAAIYGAQAGNGVVIITTKKGREGKAHVSFNGSWGMDRLGKHAQMMNAEQYVDYMTSAQAINQTDLENYWNGHTDTDWMREMFTGGMTQKYNVAIEGANRKAGYYVSMTYLRDNGILAGDYDTYSRLNVQLNADYRFTDWLQVKSSNNFAHTQSTGVNGLDGSSSENLMLSANATDPLTPAFYAPDQLPDYMQAYLDAGYSLLRDNNGNYLATSVLTGKSPNPYFFLLRSQERTKRYRFNGTTSLILTPGFAPGLSFTSRLGYAMSISDLHFYQPAYFYCEGVQANEVLRSQISYSVNYQWENFLNYNGQFGKHGLEAMAGMSYMNYLNNYARVQGSMPNANESLLTGSGDNFLYPNYVQTNANRGIFGEEGRTAAISYFARIGYNYGHRYYIEAAFRADAFDSSKLPKNHRWGYFPSVSAGWNVMNEGFMSEVSPEALSYLKLRTSYGMNGNVNALTGHGYVYSSTVATGAAGYQFDATDSQVTLGSYVNRLANEDVKWETAHQFDLGMDAKFLRDRLSFGFDFYYKQTRDLLVQIDAPYETGFAKVWTNGGTVENKGIEITLGWADKVGDFSYAFNVGLAHNDNKVTYVTPKLTRILAQKVNSSHYATVMEEGAPLWAFRGYRFDGINPETGEATYADLNEDGEVNEDDIEVVGSGQPDLTYNIGIQLEWKGIDLLVSGYGSHGNDIWFGYMNTDYLCRNLPSVFYTGAWKEAGDMAQYPKMGLASSDQRYARSSAMVMDGSYFRISQIQLGYSFPKKWLNKIRVEKLRLYASLDDFFTFSNYIGGDPVNASVNVSSGMGVDMGNYMTARKCMFGINLAF